MQRQKILVGKKNIIREIIYEKYNNNPKHNVWKLIREREREREREEKTTHFFLSKKVGL